MTLKNSAAAPTIPVEKLRVSKLARKAVDSPNRRLPLPDQGHEVVGGRENGKSLATSRAFSYFRG